MRAVRTLVRTSRARPPVRVAIGVVVAAAVLGACIPTGVLGAGSGAGIGGGADHAVRTAMTAGPLWVPLVVTALTGRDTDDAVALHLAGWTAGRRLTLGTAAATAVSSAAILMAAVLGAVVGLGDALRQGTTVSTPFSLDAFCQWPLTLTAVVVAVVLQALRLGAGSVVLGSGAAWLGFISALILFYGGGAGRGALAWLPFAPAWRAVYAGPIQRLMLPPTEVPTAVVVVVWLAVAAVLVIASRVRSWRVRGPGT